MRTFVICFTTLFAVGITGCDSDREQPPPLPALSSPIPGPPKPYAPEIISRELKIRNSAGSEISQAKTSETINIELAFQLGEDEPRTGRVIFHIGKMGSNGFVIYNSTLSRMAPNSNGEYHVETSLDCPTVGGDFEVRAQIKTFFLIEKPLKVIEAEED
ncbi:MAG: hypothetical protein WD065_06970 [Planctomycetaceae bacterium]